MNVFDNYADFYDLFYADKDYVGEAQFVLDIIRGLNPSVTTTMLELGSGTARHAIEFARAGLEVLGVDISKRMISRGNRNLRALSTEAGGKVRLVLGDVSRFECESARDVVVSLFHVVNYQTTNDKLLGMFRSARRALSQGGIFFFDFWYGPGVLMDPPSVRIKRVKSGNLSVVRLAEPLMDASRNVVEVNYTLFISEAQVLRELKETHSLRFLFLPEIELLGGVAGFEIVEAGEWLTRRPLNGHCWAGYAAMRAI